MSVHIPPSRTQVARVVRFRQSRSEVTDSKVWIKSIWCIREKFGLQNYGVASGVLLVKFFSFFILSFSRLWIWNYHRWRQGRKCYGENIYLGKISLGQQYLNHSRSLRGIKLTDFFLFQMNSDQILKKHQLTKYPFLLF